MDEKFSVNLDLFLRHISLPNMIPRQDHPLNYFLSIQESILQLFYLILKHFDYKGKFTTVQ